ERAKKFVAGFFGLSIDQYNEKFKIISDEKTTSGFSPEDSLLDINLYERISEVATLEDIISLLEKDRILERIKYLIPKAEESENIAKKLFGEISKRSMLAVEGLLFGLGRVLDNKGDSIQPQRAHLF